MFVRSTAGRYIAVSEIVEIQEPAGLDGKHVARLRDGTIVGIEDVHVEYLTRNHEGYVSAQEGSIALVGTVSGRIAKPTCETRRVPVVAWNIVYRWGTSFAIPVLAYEIAKNEYVGVLHPGGKVENEDRYFENDKDFADWCIEQYIKEIKGGSGMEIIEKPHEQ